MNYSYIIPFKADLEGFRITNLQTVLRWLQRIEHIEIILVEQDISSTIDSIALPNNCRHIFIYNQGVFNKSWAINVGYKYAKGEVLVIGDGDLVMETAELLKAMEACLRNYDAVNPYGHLIDLSRSATESCKKEINSFSHLVDFALDKDRKGAGEYLCFSGGIVIFKRLFFEKIAGFDERFEGWGGEDDAIDIKIKSMTSAYKQFDEHTAFHLWHPRIVDRKENSDYKRNCELLKEYLDKNPTEIKQFCQTQLSAVGSVYKYTKVTGGPIAKKRLPL